MRGCPSACQRCILHNPPGSEQAAHALPLSAAVSKETKHTSCPQVPVPSLLVGLPGEVQQAKSQADEYVEDEQLREGLGRLWAAGRQNCSAEELCSGGISGIE